MCDYEEFEQDRRSAQVSRRMLLQTGIAGGAALLASHPLWAALERSEAGISAERFPHFKSTPVSYLKVKMQDAFWAPRQKVTREVSVQWISSRHDAAGGLAALKKDPTRYVAKIRPGAMESIKFIEAMATVIGVDEEPDIARLIDAWAKPLIEQQGADGYLGEHFPRGKNRPAERWQAEPWSHEDYTIGHYIESAIACREVGGSEAMYRSALRAAENMAAALLDSDRAYASGHPEIEQALMRLYGFTGDTRYLRLCGWLLDQRGHHERRRNYGLRAQDHLPIRQQRTIEGHAVRAAYLYNGVTQYVGATGDAGYREAVLAVWDDLVEHKMYLHGASGNSSSRNEGYRKNPDCIPPDDTYGESCAACGNFRWAHSLFQLTGEARYLDTAERILYNVLPASLSLQGDSTFYHNLSQSGLPRLADAPGNWGIGPPERRSKDLATSCCPPNIIKLINTVGGYFYSAAADGIFVNHYGSSEADIALGSGIRVTQQTGYPWDGVIKLRVQPKRTEVFTLHLRIPQWAQSHQARVNGKDLDVKAEQGWLAVRRRWRAGDEITLTLPMPIERVAMPPRFKEYDNLIALQRGPIVYCLEEQDLEGAPNSTAPNSTGFSALATVYLPNELPLTAEHRADFLGGVTVVRGTVRLVKLDESEITLPALFVPYCVWGNREPSPMSIWIGAARAPAVEFLVPQLKRGDTCVA